MKIVIVCTLYPPYILGGAEISTSLLARGLSRAGHDVSVLTIGKQQQKELIDGITVYRIKNRNIYWRYPQREKNIVRKTIWHAIDICNTLYTHDIKIVLSQIQPDIALTGNLCGMSVIAWHILHKVEIPIIHTLRDYYLLCPQQSMMKRGQSCSKQCPECKAYSFWKRKESQKVDAVVGISRHILERHIADGYFNNATQWVVPNSIETDVSLQRNKKGRNIGYIGRISPEKGIEFLIDAFNRSNNGGRKLLIAGNGNAEYEEDLKAKYASEAIVFLGRKKKEEFFAQIGLLVVPSLWEEPFGRVVIEAYSYHVPVLMARNGGLTELAVEGISKNFSTNSTGELVGLLNDYCNGMFYGKEEIFDRILENFSEQSMVNEYVKIVRHVLKKGE